MKRTYTINISGSVFHIEEDAFEKLGDYINRLKYHFGNDSEGSEIVADIEARIAEIFNSKKTVENEVITLVWVDEIIGIMGNPEVIEEEISDKSSEGKRKKRHLYRDPDRKVVAGVCGGLAAYFNMDPVVVRLIMVLLFILNGLGLIIYLILWIAVPVAQTTAQRLEMYGEEVNVENIEKWIKKEYQEIEKSVKKIKWRRKRGN
jgi:phage shock protein PspC (stress-responsive transcriptional regulator)